MARTLEGSNPEEVMDVRVMMEKFRADLKRFMSRNADRRSIPMLVVLEIGRLSRY